MLAGIPEIQIPELQVSYNRSSGKFLSGALTDATSVSDFIRRTIGINEVELQEQFIVLYLSQSNHVIGYYKHSKGSINATVADIRIILGTALKCASIAMIVAHNHPSGNLKPSAADEGLTKQLKEAAALHNIKLLDHLIITKDNYLSFATEGLLGLEGLKGLLKGQDIFVQAVTQSLIEKQSHNKISIEKLASSLGITDKTEVKELTELAIVKRAREIAHRKESIQERHYSIVNLYNSQVNLSHRTSQSILLQQYSTPAPIGFLAGIFCRLHEGASVFEPSAGNGLLTIAANPSQCTVNEIDTVRRQNLETQGYRLVMNQDATRPFRGLEKKFDAVLTNPPFGKMDVEVMYDTFPIKPLEHVMAIRALDCMKDEGRAAIIIGGHTSWDEKGRIQAGKNRIFFNFLFSRYHVEDVINIDGHKLYSRQGTSFDVRLILIRGRKAAPSGAAPTFNPFKDKVVTTFTELYERVMEASSESPLTNTQSVQILYKNYQNIKARYPDAIVCLRDGDYYKILGDDALEVTRNTDLLIAGQFEIDNAKIRIIRFPANSLTYYQNILSKSGYRIAIADELMLQSTQPSLTDLEKEAMQLQNELEKEALELQRLLSGSPLGDGGFGAPYEPASEACVVLNTQVPDSMAFETRQAILSIKREVGGDIDNFVRHRLKYSTKTSLCKVLSAEQIDAVAMAIYNIEARGQGMIIGDQTGIGKGRVAAAMIRYAVVQGHKPVFLTEKANLFSDIYRDLSAIGSSHLRPFIVNGREPKTDIKDEDGEVVYTAPPPTEQQRVFGDGHVPSAYDFVVATYSQFNSPEKKPEKPAFLQAIADNNIFILDEAHNSSGSSNTGEFLQKVVAGTKGVVFLSATFAKRPDNMPIYAMKTSIADCNMSRDDLVDAITRGGVALQEILSSQLVAEGQMVRRERSFEGVEVNYINLDDKAEEHNAIADNITDILRSIIGFQGEFIDKAVEDLDKIAVAEGKEVDVREGTSQAGVDNQPYFSKVFQVINQMLFSLKADAVAEQTIQRLKDGRSRLSLLRQRWAVSLKAWRTNTECRYLMATPSTPTLPKFLCGVWTACFVTRKKTWTAHPSTNALPFPNCQLKRKPNTTVSTTASATFPLALPFRPLTLS